MRLQKFLSASAIASRRKAEELITAGRVSVNGRIVMELGVKVDPVTDIVAIDGKRVTPPVEKISIMLNKAAGYVTTVKDEKGRPTVFALIGDLGERVFPVGRLDMDTEGLLIFTNDGDFANLLMHPKHEVWKTYVAELRGRPTEKKLEQLRKGIELGDGPTAPAKVKMVKGDENAVVEISIREGRKRQVRRMFSAIGHRVTKLERTSYGPLKLGRLQRGKWRRLTEKEVEDLKMGR